VHLVNDGVFVPQGILRQWQAWLSSQLSDKIIDVALAPDSPPDANHGGRPTLPPRPRSVEVLGSIFRLKHFFYNGMIEFIKVLHQL
jgi:hypothetical protein